MRRIGLVVIAALGLISIAAAAVVMVIQPKPLPGRPISEEALAEIASSQPVHERYWGDQLPQDILEWSSRPHEHSARHSADAHASQGHHRGAGGG